VLYKYPLLNQVAPEVPWVWWYLEVRPHLLPNPVMCRPLQNQVISSALWRHVAASWHPMWRR